VNASTRLTGLLIAPSRAIARVAAACAAHTVCRVAATALIASNYLAPTTYFFFNTHSALFLSHFFLSPFYDFFALDGATGLVVSFFTTLTTAIFHWAPQLIV